MKLYIDKIKSNRLPSNFTMFSFIKSPRLCVKKIEIIFFDYFFIRTNALPVKHK